MSGDGELAAGPDWAAWHEKYDTVDSRLARRLLVVQDALRAELDARVGEDVGIISLCAGQGRDVLGVLASRRGGGSGSRVRALLVELDERNAAHAREAAIGAGLDADVEVRVADASTWASCADAVPADIVLACGILGNISDDDVFATVQALPQLCRPGALIIWTRSRYAPDLTPAVRAAFGEHSDEVLFVGPDDALFGVGAHRFRGPTPPLEPDRRVFRFIRTA